MKLYRNSPYGHDLPMRGDQSYTVGVIVEKSVDEYNGVIKVYQPVADLSVDRFRMFRDSLYSATVFSPGGVNFVHLSECHLTELKDDARKVVIQALKQDMHENLQNSMNVQQLLKELGEE